MFEKDLNENIRVFIHMHFRMDSNSVTPNLQYGYKLKLMEEFKLELSSFIGSKSYFQFAISTPKFKASLPIFM